VSSFYSRGEHFAIDFPGARAVFTTRRGGFSEGPYASLNLGKLTADDPVTVDRNRAELAAQIGVPMALIRQVHGTTVIPVSARPNGTGGDLPEADGQVTSLPGVAPLVMTADCLPIAVAGDGAVAMLHAGWRGLAGGILAHGVRLVRERTRGGPIAAAIGPGAGRCCYEVGEEVHAWFAELGAGARRGRNLDMKWIARHQLEAAGVSAVYDIGMCTICGDPSLLFSHRRDRGVTGRQGGLVWLS
jgi:YfiH family protein